MDDSLQKKVTRRYMTLEEAQKMLPAVRKQVQELQRLQEAIDLLESIEIEVDEEEGEEYEPLLEQSSNLTILNKEYHRLSYLFYKKLAWLEQKGCMVKDIELGLVDFWHRFQGRDIFLCWKVGESSIHFWHEVDAGYEERKVIFNFQK